MRSSPRNSWIVWSFTWRPRITQCLAWFNFSTAIRLMIIVLGDMFMWRGDPGMLQGGQFNLEEWLLKQRSMGWKAYQTRPVTSLVSIVIIVSNWSREVSVNLVSQFTRMLIMNNDSTTYTFRLPTCRVTIFAAAQYSWCNFSLENSRKLQIWLEALLLLYCSAEDVVESHCTWGYHRIINHIPYPSYADLKWKNFSSYSNTRGKLTFFYEKVLGFISGLFDSLCFFRPKGTLRLNTTGFTAKYNGDGTSFWAGCLIRSEIGPQTSNMAWKSVQVSESAYALGRVNEWYNELHPR